MSLDKAISHNKERRRPYIGAKAIDCSCRNHGSCDWCRGNREYASRKKAEGANDRLKEYQGGTIMITTGQLEEICKAISREHGSDTPVCMQFYDDNGVMIDGDYIFSAIKRKDGTLYLANKVAK